MFKTIGGYKEILTWLNYYDNKHNLNGKNLMNVDLTTQFVNH